MIKNVFLSIGSCISYLPIIMRVVGIFNFTRAQRAPVLIDTSVYYIRAVRQFHVDCSAVRTDVVTELLLALWIPGWATVSLFKV